MYSSNLRNKLFIKLFLVSNLALLSSNSLFALNLGRIITNSMFGEQLDADITIEDTLPELKDSDIKVALANSADFRSVGLRKEAYHEQLSFKPYKDDANNWFIKVRSKNPITSQFVNFLVKVDWPEGHALREYMTIMKSPVNKSSPSAAITKNIDGGFALATTQDNQKIVRATPDSELYKDYESSDLFNEPVNAASNEQPQDSTNTNASQTAESTDAKPIDMSKIVIYKSQAGTPVKPQMHTPVLEALDKVDSTISEKSAAKTPEKSSDKPAQKASVNVNSPTAKLTKKGDTLSEIAAHYAVANGMTRHQMIIAIYNSNKKAFIKDNVNKLRQNFKLDIPDATQAKQIVSNAPPLSLTPTLKDKNTPRVAKASVDNTSKIKAKTTKLAKAELPEPKPSTRPAPVEVPAPVTPVRPTPPTESPITDARMTPNPVKQASTSLADNKSQDIQMPAVKKYDALPNIESASEELNVKDLSKFNTISEDLAKNRRILHNKRLEIVTASEHTENTPTDNYLLSAEKLVAKQKENEDLKEQLYMMQAQLKDLQKIVALNQAAKKSINSANNTTDMVEQDLPIGSLLGDKSAKNSITGFFGSVTERISHQQKTARTKITDFLGLTNTSFGKFGDKLSSGKVKTIFYIWTAAGTALLCLTGIIAYLLRRRKLAVPVMTAVNDDALMADINMQSMPLRDVDLQSEHQEFNQDYEIVDAQRVHSGQLIDELNDLVITDETNNSTTKTKSKNKSKSKKDKSPEPI